MRILRAIDVKNKKVLLRTDFNISVEDGKITDDFRIKAILPTLQYLEQRGAITVILSHTGRPEGKDSSLSLKPAAEHLSKLINKEVIFLETYEEALKKVTSLHAEDVAL